MPNRRTHSLLALAAAGAAVLPLEAGACPPQRVGPELTVPALSQRAVPVPRNVALRFLARRPEDVQALGELSLVSNATDGGSLALHLEPLGELPEGVTRALFRPSAPLAPDTSYTIAGPLNEYVQLRTGQDEDPLPPPAPFGIRTRMQVHAPTPYAMCSLFAGRQGVLSFAFPDLGERVSYQVREGGRLVATDLAPPPGTELPAYVPCDADVSGVKYETWLLAPGLHTLEVTAVDLAGNASEPVSLTVNADCSVPVTDPSAPPGGVPDAGAPAMPIDGSPPMSSDDQVVSDPPGCGQLGGTAAVLSFALLLASRRRHP